MSEAPFRIREVTLAGFGTYRAPTRYLFPDGPGTLTGPNESGKSTLLLGVAATLFGLPATADAEGFSAARFRSLPAAREFWGEVVWESGGTRYRLHRAFDSHQVRWVEEGSGGSRIVFEGEHNPLAKSSGRVNYPQLLREHFGLVSSELFLEAFCLGQNSPDADDFSADLQHLISGSRTGRTDDVLLRLFEQVKERTLATGDLGLRKPGNERAVNQREPGRLERRQEDIDRARAEKEAGEAALVRVNDLSKDREAIESERKELAVSREHRKGRIAVLQEWSDREKTRRKYEDEVVLVGKQLRELDEVEAKRKAEVLETDAALGALLSAPEDISARCERLAAAEDAAAASRRAEAETLAARARLEQEVRTHLARLEGDLAPVRGRFDLPALRSRLAEALARKEEYEGACRDLRERVERQRIRLAAMPDWPQSVDPALLRARLDGFLRGFTRLRTITGRKQEIAGPLEGRHFLNDERMDFLRCKLGIEDRLRAANARIRELEVVESAQRVEAAAKAEVDTERQRTAEARHEAELAAARTEQALARGPEPLSLWLSLLAAAGLCAGLRFGLDLEWPVSAGAGAALLVILLATNFLLRRARVRAARPAATSAAIPARETQPEAKPDSPSAFAPAIDASAELETLRAERVQMEKQMPGLRERLGPFADVTGPEIGRMEERWSALATESERLDAEQQQLVAAIFGEGFAEEDPAAIPASRLPDQIQEVFRLPGAPAPGTLDDLANWASSMDEPAWERLRMEAAQWRDAGDELRRDASELERLENSDPDPAIIDELREKLQPFTLDTPEESLQAALEECRKTEEALRDCQTRLSDLQGPENLRDQVLSAEQAFLAERESLHAAWPSGPEPPQEGLRVWAEHIRQKVGEAVNFATRHRGLDEASAVILRSAGVADRAELERRQASTAAALGSVQVELDRLGSDDPFLAASREIRDPLERGARLRGALETEQRALAEEEEREAVLYKREVALRAELESRQRGPAANLSRLELQLRTMEEERERLHFERDALALAYGWVSQAAERFRGTYREDLERKISAYFSELTGREGRRVGVDDRFRLLPTEPDGSELSPAQLSQGARDQLHLAMRLALGDLLAGTVPLPLFFDDPFVHFDAERLEHLRGALERLSARRQWVLLTHRMDQAAWSAAVERAPAR